MTPKEYLLVRESLQIVIASASNLIEQYEDEAREAPLPKNLRPAAPDDIIVGALIWYKHSDGTHYWQVVGDVLHPDDPWKAYCADDGCRYGLENAWVEV